MSAQGIRGGPKSKLLESLPTTISVVCLILDLGLT